MQGVLTCTLTLTLKRMYDAKLKNEGKLATLKLPSGEVLLISKSCSATFVQVRNVRVNQKSLGRVGSKRWLGKRPVVRGVVMNPVDYPHGGGEGRAPIGRKTSTTPWGYPTLGRRSRKRQHNLFQKGLKGKIHKKYIDLFLQQRA